MAGTARHTILSDTATYDKESGDVRAVIETPKGSRNKYRYVPDCDCFELATAVMQYLQEHGVTNQMTAKGYGKADPIADNSTKDGQLTNRRVILHIVSGS